MDYIDLNKAYPKDPYPLPNIDQLVDGASGFTLLSFMEAYSGYNQIRMHPHDEAKIAFIIDSGAFCYKVMPFGLKNARATRVTALFRFLSQSMEMAIPIFNTLKKGGNFGWTFESEEAFLRLKAMLAAPPCSNSLGEGGEAVLDGVSNQARSGAGVILKGPNGVLIDQSLHFEFKASNNQAKYEALLAGIKLATKLEAKILTTKSDLKLVTDQVNGEY
ncbi:hypothetical protein CR513_28300, partial [Mucuna pruriens]